MAVLRSVAGCGDMRVDGLLCGTAWAGGAISFSNPVHAFEFESGYFSDADGDGRSAQDQGFAPLSAAQLATARGALECGGAAGGNAGVSVGGFTQLDVRYAGAGGVGDVRIANTGDAGTAYAWMPGTGVGGDVWFGNSGDAPRTGNYDNATVLHEFGHALGLKHSHETDVNGPVPLAYDSLEFTVMTYRSYVGGPTSGYIAEQWGYPQSYMMLDIAALQHIYGADFTANDGDTVYRWTPDSGQTRIDGAVAIDPGANRIFATLWDGGGNDTYDLSAYRGGVRVDLRPGHASTFSDAQRADLGGGPNGGLARGNIFNALLYEDDERSLIENVRGGAGRDSILGNAADNRLSGGDGRDHLRGFGGEDRLCGGKGADTFVFRKVSDSSRGASDTLVAGDGAKAFQGSGHRGGDVVDLSGIDADTVRGGDQAFKFGAATGRGHLWLEDHGRNTWVCGNTDGDAAMEVRLVIRDWGVHAADYHAGDFVL